MPFSTKLFIALLVALSAPVWANLRDDHKQNYPFLAKAIIRCQELGLPELEVESPSWPIINQNLDTTSQGQWLNDIEGWQQLPLQNLEGLEMLAVWLLPDAAQWSYLKNFYPDLFLAIVSSYLVRSFERVNTQGLVQLIVDNPHLASALISLFKNLPELARYLLRHPAYLEGQLTGLIQMYISGSLARLAGSSQLDPVIRELLQKGHIKLLKTFLNWLLTDPEEGLAAEIIDELLQQITHHPDSIEALTELGAHGLANQLSELVNAPPSYVLVQEDGFSSGLLEDALTSVDAMSDSIEIITSAEFTETVQPDASLLATVYGSLPPHPTTLPLSNSQHLSGADYEASEDCESPHTPAVAEPVQDQSPLTDAEIDLMVQSTTNVTAGEACSNTTQLGQEPVSLLLYPVRLSDQ